MTAGIWSRTRSARVSLDPALTKKDNRWVAEALLDAQPAGGWRRLPGPVLSRASALNRLTATRLGIEDADDSPVDAAALLQWTADRAAIETFLRLREEERTGLIAWLAETTGGVADVVFAMAATGKIFDAIPFGLAAAALYGPPAHAQAARPEPVSGADEVFVARVRAEERYLGRTSPDIEALQSIRHSVRVPGHPLGRQRPRHPGGRAVRAGRGDPRRARQHRGRQAGPGQPLSRPRGGP